MIHRTRLLLQPFARTAVAWSTATILLLAVLPGCALRLPPADPTALGTMTVPTGWTLHAGSETSGATSPTSLSSWWQRFDDPTLDALVTQSQQANTSIRSAQSALRQARALRDLASAALWPGIGYSASVQHGTAGGHSAGSSFQAGLDASWVPDVFGANRSALEASRATLDATAADLGDMQVAVAAEVGLNYLLLRTAQARLGIARDNLASQRETWQITQWRQQAGLVTVLEAEQARAAAEQTAALLPALQTSIEQTRHALAVLLGQPPATRSPLFARLDESAPIPRAPEELALAIPAETLRQRADVRAAESQVLAAWARVAQADAGRFPGFSLGGSFGWNAATLGSLANGSSVVSSLLASVTGPLFDAGSARAQVRAQEAAYEQARVAYQATVLAALKDVEDALVALRGDRQRLVSLSSASDAAARAATLARQRFSSGLVDFQVVLETQRTQFSAQDSVASATADIGADQVRLFTSLGGGWRDDRDDDALASSTRTQRTSRP